MQKRENHSDAISTQNRVNDAHSTSAFGAY